MIVKRSLSDPAEGHPATPETGAPDASEPGAVPVTLHPGVVGVLQALADPMRLAIVRHLAVVPECSCGSLGLPISKSTLSHHLHVLHAAGLVDGRWEGTRKLVHLNRTGLGLRFPGLLDAVLATPEADAPGSGD